jgi:membrane protease YdiL (CAAX protease family)
LSIVIEAMLVGMFALLVATLPRNLVFAANLKYFSSVPWAVPLIAVYLWYFWRYLGGWGPPETTAEKRRTLLRANPLSARVWAWALLAGTLRIAMLVLLLRVANRLIDLPEQPPPDLSGIPIVTLLLLLLISSIFAGVVEEASFRGYMQGPIEQRYGPGDAGHGGCRQSDSGHVRLRHEHLDVSGACVGSNGREELGLRLQRDLEAQRVAGTHADCAFHRPVAEQTHPQRVRAGRHPLDNKVTVGAGCRAKPSPEDRDRGPLARRGNTGIGSYSNAPRDDSRGGTLRGEECRD